MAKSIIKESVVTPETEETAVEITKQVEKVVDYGTVIKSFDELITTKQPTAETAEETEE